MSRLDFPACARNQGPIWAVLEPLLPEAGRILEVASGSGQHMHAFAQAAPHLRWLPSDPAPEHRASQTAWCAGLGNVEEPLDLDCREQPWPVNGTVAGILAINLIHISPWETTEALFAGASRLLEPDGFVYLYGAYRRNDAVTAPSNQAFDQGLRRRNPAWGVRLLEDVCRVAESQGLVLTAWTEMPAHNLSLVFRRAQR